MKKNIIKPNAPKIIAKSEEGTKILLKRKLVDKKSNGGKSKVKECGCGCGEVKMQAGGNIKQTQGIGLADKPLDLGTTNLNKPSTASLTPSKPFYTKPSISIKKTQQTSILSTAKRLAIAKKNLEALSGDSYKRKLLKFNSAKQ